MRTGTGSMFNNHYSAVTLAPDGSLYVATLAGMVRVRDGAATRARPTRPAHSVTSAVTPRATPVA